MDYRLNQEQKAFKKEFAEWLTQNLPEGFDASKPHNFKTDEALEQAYRHFQRKLYEGGYTAMHYPKEYGGQGKSMVEEVIVQQETWGNCIELREPGVITFGMAAPTIYSCGSEEQKRKYLPKMMDGTHIWCQGFSEPGAGSDLGNVATTAVRDGDHYIVNGQKVWTSMGHMADYCILLVRTDPSASKHKGLSYLLMDLKTPGVDVRPMMQMTGESEFCEVFMDNVKVPVENLVGEEGKGWMIAITTLMFERVLGDVIKATKYDVSLKKMIQMARTVKRSGKPVFEDPVFRQQLGTDYIDILVLKSHGLRNLSGTLKTGVPGPEGSITKLLWSLTNQKMCDDAIMMQSAVGQVVGDSEMAYNGGFWQYHFLRSKANTIEAGCSEILRNIIGERVLGLPKDMARAAISKEK